jgi:hypothetical protein
MHVFLVYISIDNPKDRDWRATVVFFSEKIRCESCVIFVYFVDRGLFKYSIFSLPLRESYFRTILRELLSR